MEPIDRLEAARMHIRLAQGDLDLDLNYNDRLNSAVGHVSNVETYVRENDGGGDTDG